MAKLSYAPRFLRKFVGELAEHAAEHGIGESFVKICEAFTSAGDKVVEHGPNLVAQAAASAPAAAAAGASVLGLPILAPLGISLALFGVTYWMKHAKEAKEISDSGIAHVMDFLFYPPA